MSFGVFCVVSFAINFGPNVAVCILPTLVFPRRVRSTYSGLSAGAGKIGALIGTFFYPIVQRNLGLPGMMYAQAVLNAIGLLATLVLLRDDCVADDDERKRSLIQDSRDSATAVHARPLRGV